MKDCQRLVGKVNDYQLSRLPVVPQIDSRDYHDYQLSHIGMLTVYYKGCIISCPRIV